MPSGQNEAFARVLIDSALKDSGWDLLNPKQVRLELFGSTGRADYVLSDKRGIPLAVLEAKREDVDPYDAKEQARGYAENLQAPFVILSNGNEHWFWNYERKDERDAYRIDRLPSPKDLENLKAKNLQPPVPLLSKVLTPDWLRPFKPDFRLRAYQIKAIDTVSKQYDDNRKRKFLLEMATGTGKTMLCAALIRRFLETQNAERVLFIVDRIELAKQTLEDFEVVLPEFKPVLFKTARRKPAELLGSSVIVATIQSLMVDRRYRTEFTPFFFDLVINDEAHRSIYGDARDVVQFFQATRLGLTATPKAYLRNVNLDELAQDNPKALEARQLRDTYHYFGCEPGIPSFRYDIIDAVKDPEGPFLCLPKIFDLRTDITTKALEANGWAVTVNEQDENFKVQDLEKKIFTPGRNRAMCAAFIRKAKRHPDGGIGKSIVFAVNQNHATELTKILNEMQPGLAMTITSRIHGASELAKEFRKEYPENKRPERVAVSVDMLSTGYNCKDLLNIALMRPVFSPTEYIQIKGRGTRKFEFRNENFKWDKDDFFLLDFCAVAEYFEEKYDYTQALELPREKEEKKKGKGAGAETEIELTPEEKASQIPIWEGIDKIVSEGIRIVGPDGEKVDVMTFRGSFERDMKDFDEQDAEFHQAVQDEDDDTVETVMNERFFHQPKMFYSPDKLVKSYGVPAATPAFVYNALGKKPLPTMDTVISDAVESIASRFDVRMSEKKWLDATAQLIAQEPTALEKFMAGDPTIWMAAQFTQLGGVHALSQFGNRQAVFDALRDSTLVRQSLLTTQ